MNSMTSGGVMLVSQGVCRANSAIDISSGRVHPFDYTFKIFDFL